jgi:hypothetical protein
MGIKTKVNKDKSSEAGTMNTANDKTTPSNKRLQTDQQTVARFADH